ncbi:MAG: pilus assembly protein CpaE [Novosphingobium aromaticivorans]|nr:pilus assembly protein CpaE [Novosphingobium aromaticivorans]
MPGSWKNGTRDIFAAFLCDDAALDVARAVAADMGWAPEKCARGGLRNAVQSLSITASPAILMVDLSECGDPLNDINALAEVCEPGTVVIAVGQVNDVRLYRDLIASGIQDYLLKPLSIGQVRDALAQAQAIFTAPKTQEGAATRQHVATAVVGTRGGVGASTLATSLAWAFSTDHKRSTALLDLDVHFGTGALTLDLEPGRGLTDAIDNPSRIDGLFIERAMIRANDHLAILSAEAPITAPLMTDGSAFMQLQEEFRHAFEMTVIDMPRNMLINFPHLLSDVNAVVLATELTLAGARDAIRLLAWLKANAPHAHVHVVANKVQQGVGEISRADFESSIERKLGFAIPFDPKAAANAARLGQTFLGANRTAKASQPIRDVAQAIAALSDTGSEPDSTVRTKARPGASLLGRFDLKKILTPKAKVGASV